MGKLWRSARNVGENAMKKKERRRTATIGGDWRIWAEESTTKMWDLVADDENERLLRIVEGRRIITGALPLTDCPQGGVTPDAVVFLYIYCGHNILVMQIWLQSQGGILQKWIVNYNTLLGQDDVGSALLTASDDI